jgi:hypothetical protein
MHRAVAAVVVLVMGASGAAAPAIAAPTFESRISLVTAGDLWASWRPGCPVGPDQLRRLTVSHWGFDGSVQTGELVVHADLAGELAAIFRDLFQQGFPIQRMVPVEHYGGSDDASMDANNTSAFNCRPVTGGTSWSKHAYGRAIDVNPIQNPYVRGSTVLPPAGRAHLNRSTPAQGKILAGSAVVSAFAARGWTWGGNWSSPTDYQHFERAGSPARPIPANTGASVASIAADELLIVARSGSGEVVQRTRTAQVWSAPSPLGGYSDSTPDAASWGPDRVDVFVLGSDGAVWHRARSGAAWGSWGSLGGGFLSGPTAASWAPGRIDVFGQGLDHALWTNSWTGSSWTGWRTLGGAITSDPDAVSWGAGRLDVFARGIDGAVWHRAFDHGSWAAWDSVGGRTVSGPGAASRGPGSLDVFAVGTDGALYGAGWHGAAWTGWYSLGGVLASDPDATAGSGGAMHIVAAGHDGASLWSRSFAGSWGPWAPWPSV